MIRPIANRAALVRFWRNASRGLLRAGALAGLREPGLSLDAMRLNLRAAAALASKDHQ